MTTKVCFFYLLQIELLTSHYRWYGDGIVSIACYICSFVAQMIYLFLVERVVSESEKQQMSLSARLTSE